MNLWSQAVISTLHVLKITNTVKSFYRCCSFLCLLSLGSVCPLRCPFHVWAFRFYSIKVLMGKLMRFLYFSPVVMFLKYVQQSKCEVLIARQIYNLNVFLLFEPNHVRLDAIISAHVTLPDSYSPVYSCGGSYCYLFQTHHCCCCQKSKSYCSL